VSDPLRLRDARKRAAGWAGGWHKTLALSTSYWHGRYDRVLYVDCGATALDAPLSDIFEQIDSHGRLMAERESDEFTDPAFNKLKLASQFVPACDADSYGSIVRERGGAANFSVGYFNTALMFFDPAILGQRNAALREIAALYHGAAGATALSDQGPLNLYWGPLTRNAWAELPRRRVASSGADCFYSHFRHPTDGCNSFLLVKEMTAPRVAARARRTETSANGWQQLPPDARATKEDSDAAIEPPVSVDHTPGRHSNWKKGIQGLLDRLAAQAGTARNVSAAARLGADAIQKSRADHADGQSVDVLSQQVEAIDA